MRLSWATMISNTWQFGVSNSAIACVSSTHLKTVNKNSTSLVSHIKHVSKNEISKILEYDSITTLSLLLGGQVRNSKYDLLNVHSFDLYQMLIVRSRDLLSLPDLFTLDSFGLNISPFENFSIPDY